MLASTCLAVVFVPSFYVVMQRIDERRKRRATPNDVPTSPRPDGPAPEPSA
jgi:HAE1 family hydrophobic/amphiphilic exporter-1